MLGKSPSIQVQHLVEQLATFTSHFATTKWGGKHGFLPPVLSEAKMRPAAENNTLDFERLKKSELINPRTEDRTQVIEILQLQAYHKVKWQ